MKIQIHRDEESIVRTIPFTVELSDGSTIDGTINKWIISVGGFPLEDIEVEMDVTEYDLTGIDVKELTEKVLEEYYNSQI